MSYTITLTDGTVFATVADGTVNSSSSVTLVGKNYAGYGSFLDENFIQHLENFSSNSSGGNPTSSKLAAPLTGQIWWDKTNSLLKVYSGSAWKTISAATAQASAPSNNVTGDLWFDTTNQQLKVWTGAAFLVVGPAYSAAQGTSGAIPETITDSGNVTKYITSLYVNNARVGIVYNGTSFTPEVGVAATFPTVYPGITLTSANSAIFAGTANNASYLNSLTSSQFMRSDTNTSTTGTLRVLNNTGLYVGTSNVLNISQNSNDANVTAAASGGNIVLQANVAGTIYNSARVLGANGTFAVANAATVGTTLNVTGNIDGGNLRTTGQMSATANIIGGNVITGGAISSTGNVSATGNVIGGNIITTSNVNAVGMSASGNVTAAFFNGDGGYLTNVSAAVSVTKIVNGTSFANIAATNGDLAVTIGGVSNVAVFTTSGGQFTNVSTPVINKTGSNAVGNIGSSVNWFDRGYVASVFSSTVSAVGNIDGGNLRTAGLVSVAGNIDGGNLRTAGLVSATGNVTGGNLVTAAAVSAASVSASGNVTGGNIVTGGAVSATGNVSAVGNVAGTYILGNGSLLTGISTSSTRIFNGTSEVNVGASGGNANISIGGVSNVVVFTTTAINVTGQVSASGNITGGNLITAGSLNSTSYTATGNIVGGNLVTSGLVTATGSLTAGGIVSTSALSVTGNIVSLAGNGVANIGSQSTYFNTVHAKATSAQYADVAERFEADEYLEPGTVVELGGAKEITRSLGELSETIFGVISTRPAYLMNDGAGQNSTHPPVAMTGRVPVRVVGMIRKGDRLVSAGGGLARAAQPGEATAFNVLGRSLEDKFNVEYGQVEAIVTIK